MIFPAIKGNLQMNAMMPLLAWLAISVHGISTMAAIQQAAVHTLDAILIRRWLIGSMRLITCCEKPSSAISVWLASRKKSLSNISSFSLSFISIVL